MAPQATNTSKTATLLWLGAVGLLVALAWWSFTNPGWHYLTRAGLFVTLAAIINHLRMHRAGSSRRWVKTLLFLDVVLLGATTWTIASDSPSATESLAIFLVPILFVLLLMTGLVALISIVGLSSWSRQRHASGREVSDS